MKIFAQKFKYQKNDISLRHLIDQVLKELRSRLKAALAFSQLVDYV